MGSLRSRTQTMIEAGFGAEYAVEEYQNWVSLAFYVFLERFNNISEEYEYSVFRSRKRGDEKYARMVKRRFYALGEIVGDQEFFGLKDRGNVSSPVLFATLEYNANRFQLFDAWKRVGEDLNRWKSYIRRKFGKFASVRVWEAHESAYPHIHIALVFENRSFFGGYLNGKRGKGKFRVKGQDFSVLRNSWQHGFSDFVLCNSVKGAFKYAGKYLMKGISVKEAGSKALKGLAMCWLFRKRSFSLSGYFAKLYTDEITLHSNSNRVVFGYMRLDDSSILLAVTKWRILGFMESTVVRWLSFQMLDKHEVGEIVSEGDFLLYVGIGKDSRYIPELKPLVQQKI